MKILAGQGNVAELTGVEISVDKTYDEINIKYIFKIGLLHLQMKISGVIIASHRSRLSEWCQACAKLK